MKTIADFQDQIQSVAAFCKRIKFNPDKDDFMDMMRAWANDGRIAAQTIEDNKEMAIRIVKRFL